MRIVERYSGRMRMFLGMGAWAALGPLRYVLSIFYGMHAGSTRPPRPGPGYDGGAKIISVGNIEVGGGGKTPCALAIALELERRGFRPAVVTGGYGGDAAAGGALSLPQGAGPAGGLPPGYLLWEDGDFKAAARELGDEAVLYMGAGIPLAVDRDRGRGIRSLAQAWGPTHIVLDDAFHRTEIAKDLDILLLDARRPFGNGRLLPYGTLREPARAVRRAGAVIFTRAPGREVPAEAGRYLEGKPVFFARHSPASLASRDGARVSPESLGKGKTALFSGIARPWSFEEAAVEAGLAPSVSFRYDDHHRYSRADVEDMTDECGRDCVFVTTAKDWAKVCGLFPEDAALLRLDISMEIDGIGDLLSPVV